MAPLEEKVKCVLWLAELNSVTNVQRRFRIHYNKVTPYKNVMSMWMKKFQESESVNEKPLFDRLIVSKESLASVKYNNKFLKLFLLIIFTD